MPRGSVAREKVISVSIIINNRPDLRSNYQSVNDLEGQKLLNKLLEYPRHYFLINRSKAFLNLEETALFSNVFLKGTFTSWILDLNYTLISIATSLLGTELFTKWSSFQKYVLDRILIRHTLNHYLCTYSNPSSLISQLSM